MHASSGRWRLLTAVKLFKAEARTKTWTAVDRRYHPQLGHSAVCTLYCVRLQIRACVVHCLSSAFPCMGSPCYMRALGRTVKLNKSVWVSCICESN